MKLPFKPYQYDIVICLGVIQHTPSPEKTIKKYKEVIETAKTIIWNGPIGVFEEKEFQNGTENVCRSVTNSKAYSLVGGGDTIAAVESFDNLSKISYVSTGGGAFLNFIENDDSPVLKLLKK